MNRWTCHTLFLYCCPTHTIPLPDRVAQFTIPIAQMRPAQPATGAALLLEEFGGSGDKGQTGAFAARGFGYTHGTECADRPCQDLRPFLFSPQNQAAHDSPL